MATHCYVYYRIDPAQAIEAAEAVKGAQEDLRRRTGVVGRRLRRADDTTTWMEIYENIADRRSFEDCLGALVSEHHLERWLAPASRRHLECFQD
jgi:hypothetical protein